MADFSAVDGIVCGDMEIVQVRRYLEPFRYIAVEFVSRGCHCIGLAKSFSLLERFLRPYPCLQVSGLFLQEIHGHIKELEACSSSQEHDFMGVRYLQELFPQGAAFVHYGAPFFRPVGDFDYSHACTGKIFKSLDGFFDGLVRKDARAGIEIMDFFHVIGYWCYKF